MANKFQKSVLERLEQEAARQKQKSKIKTPEKKPDIIKTEATQDVSVIEEAPVILETLEPQEQIEKQELQILPDIGEYLRRGNQRLAKNKTFYLDIDVIEAIKATAKSQRVTDSKLVNDILRSVLGLS